MKRKLNALLLCLMLLLVLPLHVRASKTPSLPMVIDSADLISSGEESSLEEKAQSLRAAYEMDVVILTVDSLSGKSAQDYADDYYDDNGYGYGENYSGMLFLLAMEEREWYISTCGDAIYALTDYGIQQLGEEAVYYLSSGSYYEAFDAYLDALPFYLDAYQTGFPVDGYADYSGDYYHGDREEVVYFEPEHGGRVSIAISLVIGIIAAVVVILIMQYAMNTKRPKRSAGAYLRSGSYNLHICQDMFLYSRIRKVRRQQNNSSGGHRGGGSSTHRSSSGRSHGGGGGRF